MANKVTVTFTEETKLSPDGINTQVYKKGKKYTSRSGLEARMFHHMIDKEKAEVASDEPEKKENKATKPKETKSKSKKKSSKK